MSILHYRFKVLEDQKAFGIERIGSPKWQLVLCLIAVLVVVYFSLWKGIKSSGKVCTIEKKERQKQKYNSLFSIMLDMYVKLVESN